MKYAKQLIALIVITLSTSFSFAQDGEGLFKAKCSACHMLGKDGTGPNLKNIRDKWNEAEESDFIYDWVKNSVELIESGKSQRAIIAQDYSPIPMTAQDVTNEDIDAILNYVDAYEPPAPPVEKVIVSTEEKVVVIVPNYKKNLKLFNFLSLVMILLIVGIIILSGSMSSFVKTQLSNKGGKIIKTLILAVGTIGTITSTSTSNALSFNSSGEAGEGIPWLKVEDGDIYLMLFLNVVLLFILIYFKKSFSDIFEMIYPKSEKKPSKRAIRKAKKKTVNDVLTGAVAIEEEHTILMEHEYDGIRELDNNLPPWWVWMFYGTIIFAVVYIFNYHIFKTSDLQMAEYENSMIEAQIEVDEYKKANGMSIDESNVTLLTDEKEIAVGKTLFEANCVACHNPSGEGGIGPNLTDEAWIYGYGISEVFGTIKNGTTSGMPEHASKLNPIQLQQVASFVLSLPDTKGKAAEGDIIQK